MKWIRLSFTSIVKLALNSGEVKKPIKNGLPDIQDDGGGVKLMNDKRYIHPAQCVNETDLPQVDP